MTEIAVVTDSSADIAPEKARALGIREVPVTAYVGRDPSPVFCTPASFWRAVAECGGPVRVAQPTPGDFYNTYRGILREAQSDVAILSIHAAGGLSGTLHAAHLAAEMLGGAGVKVIDSGLIGPPLGQVVTETAALVGGDHSREEIVDLVYSILSRIRVMVYAHDPERLTASGSGGWLQSLSRAATRPFRPSMYSLREGEMIPAGRCSGADEVRARFIQFIGEAKRPGFVGIMSAGEDCGGGELKENLDPAVEVEEFIIGPVLGAHLGPGSLGVFTID
ncbi:MAG: DegV family protein [Bacillota bacterium]